VQRIKFSNSAALGHELIERPEPELVAELIFAKLAASGFEQHRQLVAADFQQLTRSIAEQHVVSNRQHWRSEQLQH
jgi:hypothetical protein